MVRVRVSGGSRVASSTRRIDAHARRRAATGALAPAVVAARASRVAKVREDLLGADPDLLGVEFESECSHDDLLRVRWLLHATPACRPYQRKLHDATECAKITVVLGNEYEGQICSIARSLELVGERWTLLVVREIFHGRRKFSEMQR